MVDMIKGMIFDLDGTTLYTLNDLQLALNTTLRSYGQKEQTIEEVRIHIGRGARVLVSESLPKGFSEEQIDEILKAYNANYSKMLLTSTKPYEGIAELLKNLQDKGIKLAVNSNKNNNQTRTVISHYFPEIDFMAVFGSREGIPNKPDPYTANGIIEMMGLDKEEVIYVGDSEADIKTAHNAGIRAVGCLWGYRNKEVLESVSADFLVSKPEEILNLI